VYIWAEHVVDGDDVACVSMYGYTQVGTYVMDDVAGGMHVHVVRSWAEM
jgi:hypothetical protein